MDNLRRTDMIAGDIVEATFNPKRTDDLVPGAIEMVGKRFQFRAGWIREEGYAYAGEWHMLLEDADEPMRLGVVWVPLCELSDVRLIEASPRTGNAPSFSRPSKPTA